MSSTDTRQTWSIQDIQAALEQVGYIGTPRIATAVFLALNLQKPILVEGPPGVGKTELAKAVAAIFKYPLIRLQCYEGLDESKALYEWKYGKQLLYTQILRDTLSDILRGAQGLEASVQRLNEFNDIFYSENFLEPRPLLKALQMQEGGVLLIDEVDKSDQEFESFLLEVLSDYQVSIPEIGTIHAQSIPLVFLTSNNTREMGDALKRRCLHLYIPFPDSALEQAVVRSRVPGISESLRVQLVTFVQNIRKLDLKKQPAVSETIDWAKTLLLLNTEVLDAEVVRGTLDVLLKHEEDIRSLDADLLRFQPRTGSSEKNHLQ